MYGITGAALGAAYLLRAAGDVGDGTLSWLSPIGWGQPMRPYADERWWPLLLMVVATAGARVAGAIALRARRDEGAGILAQRPGPATAQPALPARSASPCGSSAACILGWSAGLFLSGVSLGLTGSDAESLLGDSDEIEKLLGSGAGDIVDQYFAVTMLTMALVGAGFGIQVALRMRSEETSGRLEPLLATALSRVRWAGAYVAVAMGGSLLILAANGLGAGIADAINSHDAGQLPRLLLAGVVPAPAVWVVVGGDGAAVRPRAARGGRGLGRARRLRAAVGARPAARPAGLGARPLAVPARAAAARRGLRAPCRCSRSQRSPRR